MPRWIGSVDGDAEVLRKIVIFPDRPRGDIGGRRRNRRPAPRREAAAELAAVLKAMAPLEVAREGMGSGRIGGILAMQRCLATHGTITYGAAVAEPLRISEEERIGRVVGRRTQRPDPLSVETSRKEHAVAWRRSLGGIPIPRGVHRFRTHAEADQWLWQMITRPRPS